MPRRRIWAVLLLGCCIALFLAASQQRRGPVVSGQGFSSAVPYLPIAGGSHHAPDSKMATEQVAVLDDFLSAAMLSEYTDAMHQFGVVNLEDLDEMTDGELQSVSMTPVQIRRLRRERARMKAPLAARPLAMFYIGLHDRKDKNSTFVRRNGRVLDTGVHTGMLSSWRWFEAVDTRKMAKNLEAAEGMFRANDDLRQLRKQVSAEDFAALMRSKPAKIGVMLSHYSLWAKAATAGQPLLVTEDDVVFHDEALTRMHAAMAALTKHDPQWGLLRVCFNYDMNLEGWLVGGPKLRFAISWLDDETRKKIEYLQPNKDEFWEGAHTGVAIAGVTQMWGNCGYIISTTGAKFLLRKSPDYFKLVAHLVRTQGDGSYVHIDYWVQSIVNNNSGEEGASMFATLPPLIVSSNDKADSDIIYTQYWE